MSLQTLGKRILETLFKKEIHNVPTVTKWYWSDELVFWPNDLGCMGIELFFTFSHDSTGIQRFVQLIPLLLWFMIAMLFLNLSNLLWGMIDYLTTTLKPLWEKEQLLEHLSVYQKCIALQDIPGILKSHKDKSSNICTSSDMLPVNAFSLDKSKILLLVNPFPTDKF